MQRSQPAGPFRAPIPTFNADAARTVEVEEKAAAEGAVPPSDGAVSAAEKEAEEDEKLEMAFKAMEIAFKEEMGIVDDDAPADAE